ncbi:cGMP-dependent protein kinase 2 [Engraulis encrasicolus]|uniref:cGMP-dependent protein kinase 2 n=1 Tax=Engraulis encrasicolus TaxID=184585 RepID=UPI002FD0F5F8
MGNGSMKAKPVKSNSSSGGRGKGSQKESAKGLSSKATAQQLKAKVEELEQELRRRDEELDSRRLQLRCLQEQLLQQDRIIADLTEQLQAHSHSLHLGGRPHHTLQGPSTSSATAAQSPSASALGPHPPTPPRTRAALDRRRGAKAGVSAEPSSRTYDSGKLPQFCLEKARVWKEGSVKKLITDSLNKNLYLRKLESPQIRDMVECMYERSFQKGDYVIKQGEPGNHLFVLADGALEVYQQNQLLTSIPVWSTFGELAILYNCTRTASVKAVTCVRTWALDREVFHSIMRMTAQTRHEQHRNFLRSVSLLANLPEEKLCKIVDCLEVEYYDKGDYIIREGEEGNTFYILSKGKVKVTQSTEGQLEPQVINMLQKGDYFGEKALISDDLRSANIIADEDGVECLVIDRETFDQTVGTFSELQKYLQGYVETLDRDDKKRQAKKMNSLPSSPPLSPGLIELNERDVGSTPRLSNLEVITTLGVGGFGRVELVKVKNEDLTYALKRIKKAHVVENKQEEHIHSERRILAEVNSPFIIKLHRTYRDSKYVYMLLEACLGGEIWSLLRDRGSFDEHTSRFCVACVTEAFDYLHHKGIIYRDLKPENLMLDAEGYIKLVDFGFAKKMKCGQRTWTFCGTPEYVAPEIILNKGHSFSVDFWSLGILVFEILTGSPPFTGSDQMITYTFILRGIESLDFPKRINKRAADLIRKLCRQNPSERLGNLKNGITDIKKHRWFSGFSWSGLRNRTLKSPLKRELRGPTDHSYFDTYPPDEDTPPDELSGWDMDF